MVCEKLDFFPTSFESCRVQVSMVKYWCDEGSKKKNSDDSHYLNFHVMSDLYFSLFMGVNELQLAKKHHPDMNKDDPDAEKKFQEINKAYEVCLIQIQ